MAIDELEQPSGFWSYVHDDNDNEDGRILDLADRLKKRYKVLTGREIKLFTDRDISWGAKWEETINDAITETTFFIAIVTPSYLNSQACRSELLQFSENAKSKNVPELLLSIIYADVPDLNKESPDNVKAAIASAQFVHFEKLSLESETSPEYRKAVDDFARSLIQIEEDYGQRPDPIVIQEQSPSNRVQNADPNDIFASEEPGFLDAKQSAEQTIPEWTQTVEQFSTLFGEIEAVTKQYTEPMQKAAKKGSAATLVVARKFAHDLTPVADAFQEVGREYITQARSMNSDMAVMIAELDNQDTLTEGQKEDRLRLFETMREINQSGRDAVTAVEEFQKEMQSVAKISKDIRKPLGTIYRGTQSFVDGQSFFEEWVKRADAVEKKHKFECDFEQSGIENAIIDSDGNEIKD